MQLVVALAFLGLAGWAAGCGFLGEGVDERAPRIQITAPRAGDVVGGQVLLRFSVEAFGRETNAVSFIRVRLDDSDLGEARLVEATQPYFVFAWDSRTVPDGSYMLEAVAFDAANARGLSAQIPVEVRNESIASGPTTTIVTPRAQANIAGLVPVIVGLEETGPSVTAMDLLVDGVVAAHAARGPFIFTWDTGRVEPGLHVLQIRAYSGPDVFAYSESLELNVTRNSEDKQEELDTPGLPRFLTSGFSGSVEGSIAIGFNNDLYVSTLSDTLYAYSPSGQLRWKRTTTGPLRTAPVIDGNENLFVVTETGYLHGFDPTGRPLWAPHFIGSGVSMPTLGVASDLYFGDAQGRLHRFDTFSGTSFSGWPRRLADGGIAVPPVITDDGMLLVAALDGTLYGLERSGSVRWKASQVGVVRSGLALHKQLDGGETMVYAVSANGVLHALETQSGSPRWTYTFSGEQTGSIRSAPVVAPDGAIYVGTSTGLVSINPNGSLRGRFAAPDVGTAAIDTNGQIYFVSGQRLMAIRNNNTPVWTFNLQGVADGPITIRRDGLLLVAASNQVLYAINTGSQGLARSNWPMFQRNARHTGRIGLDGND